MAPVIPRPLSSRSPLLAGAAGRRSIALLALVVFAPMLQAAGPTVDPKQFPKLVRLLLLPEEQALLKELKSDDERLKFQAIFWGRRDPTPATAVNEFEDNVRAAWARSDKVFAYPHQKGAETGCGQVLALLGKPEEVLGLETRTRFDSLEYVREGDRKAETWVYRDRPGQPFHFTRAELRIAFDSDCRFAEGGILLDDLRRAAAAFVTRSEVGYTRGADGKLVTLEQQVSAAAGAIDLLTAPRNDFPLAAETHLVLRGAKGEALVAGLVRVPAELATGRISLAVRAEDADGQPSATAVRDSDTARLPDGSGVASWSVSLKPGRQKLTVAVSQGAKGSAATVEVEVPDYAAPALVASPIVAYPDEPATAASTDPRDPFGAMQLGSRRIHPRYGNVFTPADGLIVVATLYGAKLDGASGQAALRARYTVLKDGKPVARGAQDEWKTADAVASVGPIPLASYAPGAYVVRLEATDAVAQQTLKREASFEIRVPGATP